jgi:hypothetical protein
VCGGVCGGVLARLVAANSLKCYANAAVVVVAPEALLHALPFG